MPFMQYPSPAFLPPSDAAEFLKYCRDNKLKGYSYSWKLTPTYGDLFADYSGMRVGAADWGGLPPVEFCMQTQPVSGSFRVAGAVADATRKIVGGNYPTALLAADFYLYCLYFGIDSTEPITLHGGFSYSFNWSGSTGGEQVKRERTWMKQGRGASAGNINGIDFSPNKVYQLWNVDKVNTAFLNSPMFVRTAVTPFGGLFDFGEGFEAAQPVCVCPAGAVDYSKEWSISVTPVPAANIIRHESSNMPFCALSGLNYREYALLLIADYTASKIINNPIYPNGII